MGCDLAFEFAIWGPSGLLSSQDNWGFLDFSPPKYFLLFVGLRFFPRGSPERHSLLPGFGRRKVRDQKRSRWGSRAAWRESRAGQSNRAPGRRPRGVRGTQSHPPGRKRASSSGVLGGSAKPEATQGPLRTQPRVGLDAAEM